MKFEDEQREIAEFIVAQADMHLSEMIYFVQLGFKIVQSGYFAIKFDTQIGTLRYLSY